MLLNRIVEYVFFFGFMGIVGYLLWLMFAPFITALALAAVIVTICYPMYEKILAYTPRRQETVASLITTLLVLIIVILPITWLTSVLVGETVSIYKILGGSQYTFSETLGDLEDMLASFVPGLNIDLAEYLRQSAQWFAGNLGAIFAGTASTIFSIFIAMIGTFYFFRDGREFTQTLIRISPLPDGEDSLILRRMAIAVRSVATGVVLVAIIQGTLTAIGLTIFGFERAILLGTVAAIGALIPSVGTSIVFVPTIGYLLFVGAYGSAIGLTIWAALAVGLIDNLLGPYFMSRGATMHPFLILLAVLGGIVLFGPIGFIVGPVILSLFIVLIQLYMQHIAPSEANGLHQNGKL